MKTWYTNLWLNVLPSIFSQKITLILILAITVISTANAQQELVFDGGLLQSGTAGADGTVYRFSNVTTNVDALVKINARSSELVTLIDLDLSNIGHNKALQPQVTYNNGSVDGNADWWMEFQITFVEANTSNPVLVSSFDATGIDVDGDGVTLNEYVSFYNQQSYITENNTLLSVTNLSDSISGQLVTGKKFNGPISNFVNIDTSATNVMVTNKYQNINSFTIRTGATTVGYTNVTARMYSFWFKGFSYQTPLLALLPITLINWNAAYNNNSAVTLKWNTTLERNASHFVIEKSLDGLEYFDAALVIAKGNSDNTQSYFYNDQIPTGIKGIIYYRLRIVDRDGKFKRSEVKQVHLETKNITKIIAYPNPVINELGITTPVQWIGKRVTYQLLNANGNIITKFTTSQADQTETLKMAGIPVGTYILKVSHDAEIEVQTILKLRN
jgi:hypothetical protein